MATDKEPRRTCKGMTAAQIQDQIEIRRDMLRTWIIFKIVSPLPVQADIYWLSRALDEIAAQDGALA